MSTSPSTVDEQHRLQRGLSSAQMSMIGLSGALGTGLFLGSGSMIATAGPASVISYALTGLLSLVVVWCLAEMTVVHPVEGGFGAVAHAYLGPLGGWLVRWNVAIVLCIAVGAEVVAAGSYLLRWFPGLHVGGGTVICSLVIIAINLATVKAYGHSEYWFSIIKVGMVLLFLALGVVIICFGLPGTPRAGLHNLTQGQGWHGFAPYGWGGIITGAVMGIFSFGGTESVSVAAAESENPLQDVPRAAHAMIVRLALFYVGAVAVIVALEPWQKTAAGTGQSPFVRVLSLVNVPHAADLMNLVLITAALSSANGCLYGSARMLHSLATDGLAPKAIARTSEHGAPRVAVAIATVGLVIASVLAITRPDDAFMALFGVLVFGTLLSWLLITILYVVFRRRRAALGLPESPSRLVGGPALAVAAAVVILACFVKLAFIKSLSIAIPAGVPYVVLLLVAGVLVTRRHRYRPSVLDDELAARR